MSWAGVNVWCFSLGLGLGMLGSEVCSVPGAELQMKELHDKLTAGLGRTDRLTGSSQRTCRADMQRSWYFECPGG